MSITSAYFDGLTYWNDLTSNDPKKGYVIYGGDQEQIRQKGRALSWRDIHKVEI